MIDLINRQREYRLPRKKLEEACALTLGRQRWNITLVFVDEAESKAINSSFLKHRYATDVICFDLSQGKLRQAELILCPAIAKVNAATYSVTYTEELCRYVIHGMLHLLGYDDQTDADKARMWKRQEIVVSRLKP